MRFRRPTRAAAALPFVISVLCFGATAPARAAVPFQVGVGKEPDVVVAPNGTAHIVWISRPIGAEQVHYCQVPRGARACSIHRTMTPPGTGDRPEVLLSGTTILIAAGRGGGNPSGTFLYSSANGGQSFSGPTRIGTLWGLDEAVLGPGAAISGVDHIDGYQRMPLSGLPLPTSAFTHGGWRSVALFQGQIPIVASAAESSIYDGTGDHNDSQNWREIAPHVPAAEGEVELAGGPQGVVLLYRSRGALIARKFTGSSFSTGVRVSEVGDPLFPGVFADPATGAFHAVWLDNHRSPEEVRWAVSADGVRWSGPHSLVREDGVLHTEISAAPDRQGLAVWDRGSFDGPVRAAALEPLAGGTGPGPGPGPGPIVDGPTSSTKLTTLIGGIAVDLSLTLPRDCVPRPNRLRARLKARQIRRLTRSLRRKLKVRRLKRGGFKITRVDFRLNGRPAGTDRRRPFEVVLGTAGLGAGRHTVAATVHIKRTSVRRVRGKRRTVLGKRTYRRALRKGFTVCA